jgi:crotonobetainyl-CoA:carnitine CoA-transferase CaiB-like acyl-CoA transferase
VLDKPQWLADARFATPALRDRNANDRLNLTQSALLLESSAHWLELLDAAGVPCAPVLTRKAMIEHPQVLANELIIEIEHPEAGTIRQTRPAARFSKTLPEIRYGAPRQGEHTTELLTEIGITAEQQAKLREHGIIL